MPAIFSSQGFMPHGHCYLWRPELIWLHVVSDSLIFVAYVSIPATLIYLVRKRSDLPFDWMFVCFGAFIVSCGLTHLLEVWTLWVPSYWLSGAVKAVTAAASLCTAALLMMLVPKAIALPSPNDMRRASAALEASDARFRAAAEGSGDAFYILDAIRDVTGRLVDFSYVYANSHARLRIVEPRPADLSGRRLSEFSSEIVLRTFLEHCQRVLQSGHSLNEEVCVELPGAPPRWLELQIVPLGGGVAVTSRDVTERKRAEDAVRRAEERFRGLLESAPDAMVIVDAGGKVVFVNARAQTLFGYEPHELLGQSVDVLLPRNLAAAHAEQRAGYSLDPQPREMGSGLDLHARRKDGSEIPVEISLSPLLTGSGPLVSSAIRDVSVRRATENALKLANQELEAFSYSVAHDLRAPLRGMSGFARILLDDHAANLDAEAKDCLDEINMNAQRMGKLIDALLSLARVARSELRLERVDMSALINAVSADFSQADPGRTLELVVQPGLAATMDLALARTLLTNLIGNAWKFTHHVAGARIEVGASVQNGSATFFVRDNGAGFDMSFANKLFKPFQRLHAASEFPGTGIGLATVQRIVHRHGGNVWAEGGVNAGATFYFRIPVSSGGTHA
jgi:PAS domain S-box-containing protein